MTNPAQKIAEAIAETMTPEGLREFKEMLLQTMLAKMPDDEREKFYNDYADAVLAIYQPKLVESFKALGVGEALDEITIGIPPASCLIGVGKLSIDLDSVTED